jgi:hypothetical protein
VVATEIAGSVVRLRDSKNGQGRAVPPSPTERGAALVALAPLSAFQVEHRWRRAGVRNLHFYDLRHEAVSRLFERRLTAEEVMAWRLAWRS